MLLVLKLTVLDKTGDGATVDTKMFFDYGNSIGCERIRAGIVFHYYPHTATTATSKQNPERRQDSTTPSREDVSAWANEIYELLES